MRRKQRAPAACCCSSTAVAVPRRFFDAGVVRRHSVDAMSMSFFVGDEGRHSRSALMRIKDGDTHAEAVVRPRPCLAVRLEPPPRPRYAPGSGVRSRLRYATRERLATVSADARIGRAAVVREDRPQARPSRWSGSRNTAEEAPRDDCFGRTEQHPGAPVMPLLSET